MVSGDPGDGSMTLGRMLFSPTGRIPRFDALFASACLWVMFAAAAFVWAGGMSVYARHDLTAMARPIPWVVLGAPALLAAWMGVCVLAKRCHDRDRSALFLLLGLIPIANIWLAVELFLLRGTKAANRFGPAPEGMASQWRATNEDL